MIWTTRQRALLTAAGLTVLAMLIMAMAGAGRADAATIYWSDGFGEAIGRANTDGSGVNRSFIGGAGSPGGVAVDAGHIFWADDEGFGTDTIGRANADGSGLEQDFIAGVQNPNDVAVDAAHVYWSNAGADTIGRADLDGTDIDNSFITGASFIAGLAVDAKHLYWANSTSIGRADLDGGNVDQSFIGGTSATGDVAVDAGHVYWANSFGANSGIGRADLDGGNVDQSFIGGVAPQAIAVDGSHIYATHPGGGFSPAIARANLNGSGLDEDFIGGSDFPLSFGLAIGSGSAGPGGVIGTVHAKRKQKQRGRGIAVKVQVEAEEGLTAKITGKLIVKRRGFRLQAKTKQLSAGQTKGLKLKPSKKRDQRQVAKALKRGKRAKAKLRARLSDQAGNTKTTKLSVSLKR